MLQSRNKVIKWFRPQQMNQVSDASTVNIDRPLVQQQQQQSLLPVIMSQKSITTDTTTTLPTHRYVCSERRRRQPQNQQVSRDKIQNLLLKTNMDFCKCILLIWLVINYNVNLVLSVAAAVAANTTSTTVNHHDNIHNLYDNNVFYNSTNFFDLHPSPTNAIVSDDAAATATAISGSSSSSSPSNNKYDQNHLTKHFIVGDDDIEQQNHFTSTWAVHVPGGRAEADRVAAEHGFVNLGEVSEHFPIFSYSRACFLSDS